MLTISRTISERLHVSNMSKLLLVLTTTNHIQQMTNNNNNSNRSNNIFIHSADGKSLIPLLRNKQTAKEVTLELRTQNNKQNEIESLL